MDKHCNQLMTRQTPHGSEFPATYKGLSQTSPTMNPPCIPYHWHPHLMNEETPGKDEVTSSYAKEQSLVRLLITDPCPAREPLRKRVTKLPLSLPRICGLPERLLLSHFLQSTTARSTGIISNSVAQGRKIPMLHVSTHPR